MKLQVANEDIKRIDELQGQQNDGRGVVCVRHIVDALRLGNVVSAQNIWQGESDKIHQYPNLYLLLYSVLGCTTHQVHDCADWLCVRVKGFVVEDAKRSSGFVTS